MRLLCLLFSLSCINLEASAEGPAQKGGLVPGTSGIYLPSLSLSFGKHEKPTEWVSTLRIVFLLTVLTLAPAIMILMTSFTRIVIVLSFLRQALGTQQMPPNQLLVGLSLFISFFIMSPVWDKIQGDALDPYMKGVMSDTVALKKAEAPLRQFMLRQTRQKDLELFLSMSQGVRPKTSEDVSILVLVPSFVVSELKTAFQIGFMIYLPFLVLDLVVATVLMSMGMMMLPPAVIALPLKLLLFVLVDGWELVIGSLVKSFGMVNGGGS